MSVVVLQSILISVVMFISSFLAGNLLMEILKKETFSIVRSIVYGFVVTYAMFSIVGMPFILKQMKFSCFFYLFLFLWLILIVVSFVVLITRKSLLKYSFFTERKINVFFIIAVVLILGQAFLSSYLYHTDLDDGYFVTASLSAIEKDEINLDGNYIYLGDYSINDSVRPEFSSWEIFIAFIAKLSNVHPAILDHSILPFVFIPLCYLSLYILASALFKDKNKAYIFLIVYALLNIFSGYSSYTAGAFLILRIWQGKAMMVNFAFPLLLSSCVEIYFNRDDKSTWINNLLICFSGAMMTVVGVYLMPIYYFVIGMPLIIKKLFDKDKKVFLLIRNAFLTLIPTICLLIYVFFKTVTSQAGVNYLSEEPPKWNKVIMLFRGEGLILALFIVSLLALAFMKEHKTEKLLIIGMTVFHLCTFFNPLLCNFVSQKITGVAVYWRLFWLLPFYLVIAYSAAEFINIGKAKLVQFTALVSVAVIIIFCGDNIYKEGEYFTEHKNEYKLPDNLIKIAKYFSDEKYENMTILLPEGYSDKIRQYTSKVNVVYSRKMSSNKDIIHETEISYMNLYDKVYKEKNISGEESLDALHKLDVDYICTENEIVYNGNALQFDRMIGRFYIYKFN